MMTSYHLFALISVIVSVSSSTNNEFCSKDQKSCSEEHNKYSRGIKNTIFTYFFVSYIHTIIYKNEWFIIIYFQDSNANISIWLTESNNWSLKIKEQIKTAVNDYVPCKVENCSCHKSVIDEDLAPFKGGITKELFDRARAKATKYQVI